MAAHEVASFCAASSRSCPALLFSKVWLKCMETSWAKEMPVRSPWPAWRSGPGVDSAGCDSELFLREGGSASAASRLRSARLRAAVMGKGEAGKPWRPLCPGAASAQCQSLQSFWLRAVQLVWPSVLCLLVSPLFKGKWWHRVCYMLKRLIFRTAVILRASKMHTGEAAMNVIPSGMKYWSDTCCSNGVIYRNWIK